MIYAVNYLNTLNTIKHCLALDHSLSAGHSSAGVGGKNMVREVQAQCLQIFIILLFVCYYHKAMTVCRWTYFNDIVLIGAWLAGIMSRFFSVDSVILLSISYIFFSYPYFISKDFILSGRVIGLVILCIVDTHPRGASLLSSLLDATTFNFSHIFR